MPHPLRRAAGFCLLLALAPGCSRKHALDHSLYETSASAAVVQQILAGNPDGQKAKVTTVVVGPRLEASTPEFQAQFASSGRTLVPAGELTWVEVGREKRIIHLPTKQQPLQVQISTVESRGDGSYDIVAAWAYETHMARQRFVAKPADGGKWDVKVVQEMEKK